MLKANVTSASKEASHRNYTFTYILAIAIGGCN